MWSCLQPVLVNLYFSELRPLITFLRHGQGEHDHHRPQAAPYQGLGPPQGELSVRYWQYLHRPPHLVPCPFLLYAEPDRQGLGQLGKSFARTADCLDEPPTKN